MAKISKKPPEPQEVEISSISRAIFEGMDDAGIFINPEPVNQIPNVDMYSTPKELKLEVEMPGVKKSDISVSLHKSIITIKAVKFECIEEDKINYVCMERSFGKIFRSIELPFPVDTGRIKAVYKDGILSITLPRVEEKRAQAKKIDIESA